MNSSEPMAGSWWREWGRRNRLMLSMLAHVGVFAVAWFLSFCIASNFNFTFANGVNWITEYFLPLLAAVLVIKLIVFGVMGMHRGSWRYVSLRDVFAITQAAWISFFFLFILYYTLQNLDYFADMLGVRLDFHPFDDRFPDSVFLLDFAGTIALVCGARLAVRLYHEEVRPVAEGAAPRLLIVGAGNAGENAAREVLRMPVMHYQIVGFLDDDPAKHRAMIHGFEVLGPIDQIKAICAEHNVDEILIAIPSAGRTRIRRVIELCQGANLRFKTLPAMSDLIAGRAKVSEIRTVEINDLLGRAPVKLDDDEIAKFIRNRVVMVTGAGGSIGSEMCRQICAFHPQRLLLVEQSEHHLFEIDRELRRGFKDIDFVPYIADITDAGRMDAIFAREKPMAIFHAAAHKHVPMMEYNPGEAIKNNIHGTRVVADCSTRHNCEKFVMISTDKAVNPTSVMGCSKRVAEMYIQGLNARTGTQFVTVRFGNVLGSSGSVIPIFRQQIAAGGPVTVTHPDMVRYFMTIPEAAQLVLQAASMGHGGEIFVLDMGEPVKIVDLARQMIILSGFRPDEDIRIEFSGIRPGEKLFEELAIEGEDVARTPHPKIGIWRIIPPEWDRLLRQIEALVSESDGMTREQARRRLKEIVPEFYEDETSSPAPAPTATRTYGALGDANGAPASANGEGGDPVLPAESKPTPVAG